MEAANRKIPMSESKAKLYRTAKAVCGCAHFAGGDYVSVKYHRTENGTHWFEVSKNGLDVTWYPQHHLTDFVL